MDTDRVRGVHLFHPARCGSRPGKDALGLDGFANCSFGFGCWCFYSEFFAEREQDIAKENRETDRQIARDMQHQATLETYFDRMTELILDNGLGTDKETSGARSIARTRTLVVLRSLDAERVGAVFRFIQDAELKDVISLAKGNL